MTYEPGASRVTPVEAKKLEESGARPARQEGNAAAVPCPLDPAKDCVECNEYDECQYTDRRSSITTIGLPMIIGGSLVVLVLTVIAFMVFR